MISKMLKYHLLLKFILEVKKTPTVAIKRIVGFLLILHLFHIVILLGILTFDF